MNKIFRVIWNAATQSWVVVSELSKVKAKSASSTDQRKKITKNICIGVMGAGTLLTGNAMAATLTSNTLTGLRTELNTILAQYCVTTVATGGAHPTNQGLTITNFQTVLGMGATAYANTSEVSRSSATAIGGNANAAGHSDVAIGSGASTYHHAENGWSAVAIGNRSSSTNLGTVAIGENANASNQAAMAIGVNTVSSGIFSTALASCSTANATGAVAIGAISTASGLNSTAIGTGASATAANTLSVGRNARASVERAMAMGESAAASATNAIAIGGGTSVSRNNTVALGNNLNPTTNNAVVLGTNSTDRAHTTQSTAQGTYTGTYGTFAGTAGGVVSVGSVGGERQIINVAPGAISATSTDAINGSQLYHAVNAASTEVAQGNHTRVAKTTGADGHSIYTVNANHTALVQGTNMRLTSTTAANGTTTYTVNANNSVVAAGTHTNVTSATTAGGTTTYTVNANHTTVSAGSGITVTPSTPSANTTNYQIALTNNWLRFQDNNGTGSHTTKNLGTVLPIIGRGDATSTYSGDNIRTVIEGSDFVIKMKENPSFTNVTTSDGFYVTNGPALTTSGINAGSKKITNVTAGTNATDAVNLAQLNATKTIVQGNGVTSVANANGSTTYTVSSTDTNTQASVSAGEYTSVAAGPLRSNAPIEVSTSNNANGTTNYTVNVITTTLQANSSGSIDKPSQSTRRLVNASSVADAINSSGWTITTGVNGGSHAGAATPTLVNPGSTVSFMAGDNLIVDQNAAQVTYKLNPTLSGITAITMGANNGGINMNGGAINNLAAATRGDQAVNLSQLNATKTIVQGSGSTTVSASTNTDGSTTYTVSSVGGTDTSASVSAKSNAITVTNNGTTNNVTDYAVDLSDDIKDQLNKEESVSGSEMISVVANGTNDTGGKDFKVDLSDKAKSDILGAKNEVAAGSNVNVESASGDNGQTIYTVNADGASASNGSDYVTVKADAKNANNITNYVVDLSDATKQSIDQIAKGWNVTTSGNAQGSSVAKVDLGDTVTFDAGTNINITQNGKNISIATSMSPVFDSVTTTTLIVNPNGKIDMGGNVVSNIATPVNANDATTKEYVDNLRTVVTSDNGSVTVKETDNGAKTFDLSVNMNSVEEGITLKYQGDSGEGSNKLSEQVTFAGSSDIVTKAEDGKVSIDLSQSAKEQLNKEESVSGSELISVVANGTNDSGGKDFKVDLSDKAKSDILGAKNEVAAGSNVNVESASGDNGQTIYTVNADGASASNGSDYVTVKADAKNANNITNYVVDLSDATKQSIDQIAKGWNVTTSGNAQGSSVAKVDLGDTVTFDAGTNINITQNGKNISIATSMSPVFDSVTTTTLIVNPNGKIDMGGNVVSNIATPVNANDATTKEYVDNLRTVVTSDNGSVTVKETDNGAKTFDLSVNMSSVEEGITLKYQGDSGEGSNKLSEQVTFAGSSDIVTKAEDGKVSIDLSQSAKEQLNKEESVSGSEMISVVANGTNDTGGKDFKVDLSDKAKSDILGAKNEVAAGSNVNVESASGDNGQTIYTVNADGASASNGSDYVTVKADAKNANNITNYVVDLSDATKQSIDQIAKGWNVTTSGNTNNAKVHNVKMGDLVTIEGGKNIQLTQEDGKISIATAERVSFSDVTAENTLTIGSGDSTTNLTSTENGLDVGGDKITNVANGTISETSTDAVNGSQLYAATNNLIEKGLAFKGNTGETIHKALGEVLNIEGALAADAVASARNVRVDAESGKLIVKITETPTFTNITAENTLTIGSGDNTTNLTSTENGLDVGGDKITNVSNGTVSSDSQEVVTGSQLYAVQNMASAGWNLSTAGDSANSSNVAPNATVDLSSNDKNLVISHNGTNVIFDLSSNLNIGGKGEDGKDGVDGRIGVAGADGKDGVVINGNGSIALNGRDGVDGKDGASATLTIVQGAAGLDGNDGANGETKTRIVYEKANGQIEEVATLNDGLKFKGDNDTVINRTLNQQLDIVGGAQGNLTDNNIGVVGDANGTLTVKLAENIDLGSNGSVTIGSTKVTDGQMVVGNATLTENGLSVNNTESGKPVSITDKGIDAGEMKVTNVADGAVNANSKDAVNGSQLYAATNNLIEKGLAFKGNTGETIHKALGEVLNIEGALAADAVASARNVRVDAESGKLIVKITETPTFTNITAENTLTIGSGDNTTNLTSTENGLDVGGDKITNVANGTISENSQDAVTGSQLYAVQNIANAGWNISTAGDSANSSNVAPNATVDLSSNDKNLVISHEGTNVTFDLSSNLNIGEKGADGKDGVDGQIGVNGKDGSAVVLNGKDGSIGLNGKDGKDGLTFKSADGAQGVDGKDGENGLPGANGTTRIVYQPTDAEGNPTGDVEQVATLNDGLIFTGNNELLNRHKLNTLVTIIGEGVDKATSEAFQSASGNINVKADEKGTLEIQLAKDLNLTENGSVTMGDTVINNDGLTITNGPSVTHEGINAGDKVISNVADGAVNEDSKDAVNGSQLYAVQQTANAGWNLSTAGDSANSSNVAPNATVDLSSNDKNLVISHNGTNVIFDLSSNLNIGGKGEDGKDGVDGQIGVNGKDGSAVVLNGKDGSIGLNGKDGKDGLTFKSADGAQGVDGKDGENGLPGANGTTRIVYQPTDAEGNPTGDVEQVATLNDGLIFTGNNELLNRHKLNTLVTIIGEGVDKATSEAFQSASGNINVKADEKGTLEIQLAKDLNLTENGSVTMGDTVINNDGLTITNGPSVTHEGINAGDKVISNVADGAVNEDSKDAVNGSQLYAVQQTANAGWNLSTAGDSANSSNVAPNATVDLSSNDKNLVISHNGTNVIFDLSSNLNIGGKGEDGKDGVDGRIGVAGADGKDGVVLNGNGSIALNGRDGVDGKDGANATLTIVQGAAGLDGNDGANGETKTRIVYEKENGQIEEVATLNDGLKFKGDNDTVINRTLNQQLDIVGGAQGNLSDNNIGVVGDANGTLTVKLAENIDLGSNGSVTMGNTTLNNEGIHINNVSLTEGGLNNGGNALTNIANGTNATDAVNVQQLNAVNATANAGWNLTVNGGENRSNIAPAAAVDLNNTDGNIVITKEANNVSFNLAGNLSNISSVGINGKDGVSGTMTFVNGQNGVDGANGENGMTRIEYVDHNGNSQQVATLNDGLVFAGDFGQASNRTLGSRLNIVGGAEQEALTQNNIGVTSDGNGTLTVQLSRNMDLTDKGSVTLGNTQIIDNALVFANGTTDNGGVISGLQNATLNASSTEAVNGSQLYATNQNISDINTRLEQGWGLTAEAVEETNGSVSSDGIARVRVGDEVKVRAGNNVRVTQTGRQIDIAVSDTPHFNSVTVGGDNGVTLSGSTANDGVKELSVGTTDAPARITNVAPAVKGTDAVNLNQLSRSLAQVGDHINKVDRNLRAGIAGAMAAGGLYQASLPGKSMISAGVGTYRGENALAVGYSKLSDNGKVGVKFSVNANSRGDTGAAASVGYQW